MTKSWQKAHALRVNLQNESITEMDLQVNVQKNQNKLKQTTAFPNSRLRFIARIKSKKLNF